MNKISIILAVALLSSSAYAQTKEPALARINAFAKDLKAALSDGMKKGIEQAISVCKKKAPEIAKKHSTKNIRVGRVSHKNRNPANAVKPWMRQSVDKFLAGEVKAPFLKVEISKNRYGVVKPIKTAGLCLTCHGKQLAPTVKAKLEALYPNDKATGFAAGDIRGFFYAEVSE